MTESTTDKLESLNPATGDVVGVHPIDDTAGRRPPTPESAAAESKDPFPRSEPGPDPSGDAMTQLLFPDGVSPLPDAMRANGERMHMAYVVGVLMGNRDLQRRLAAEARGEFSLAA